MGLRSLVKTGWVSGRLVQPRNRYQRITDTSQQHRPIGCNLECRPFSTPTGERPQHVVHIVCEGNGDINLSLRRSITGTNGTIHAMWTSGDDTHLRLVGVNLLHREYFSDDPATLIEPPSVCATGGIFLISNKMSRSDQSYYSEVGS